MTTLVRQEQFAAVAGDWERGGRAYAAARNGIKL